jgi:hypothetical protein
MNSSESKLQGKSGKVQNAMTGEYTKLFPVGESDEMRKIVQKNEHLSSRKSRP